MKAWFLPCHSPWFQFGYFLFYVERDSCFGLNLPVFVFVPTSIDALISFTCPLFPRYHSFTLRQFVITPCVSNVPDFLPVWNFLVFVGHPVDLLDFIWICLPVLDSLQGFDPCLPRAPSLYIRYYLNSIIELPPLSRMSLHLGPIPRPPCSTAGATFQTFQGALPYQVGLFSKLLSKLSTVSALHTTPTNAIAIREGEHSSGSAMAFD